MTTADIRKLAAQQQARKTRENENMKTTTMNEALTAELKRLGWNPARVGTWGRRVDGNPGGVTIEHNGETRYIGGPFTAVRGGDQIAIVRWG